MTALLVNVDNTDVSTESTSDIKRQVAGNIKVIDGCRFRISNMTLIPTGQAVYWYALPAVEPTEEQPKLLARVVLQALGNYNGQTIDFVLAPGFEFKDFKLLLVYSEGDHKTYGAFGVAGKVKDHFQIQDPNRADLKLDPENPYNSATRVVVHWYLSLPIGVFLLA